MSESYRDIITTPNPTATTYEDYVRGIEDLFSRLADAGVYKGDRGENLKAAPINLLIQSGSTPLTYESFTEEGKELLRAIFDDKNPAEVFVTGGEVNMLKKLEFFNSVNTYTWWCTDGDTDKKIFPSTAFVYIDPNATCIRDYSCLLTPKLEPNSSTEEYDLHYSKSEVFPSFWYNPLVFNGKGGWCWKINGVNTDIPASAANDTGEYNNKLFLIRKFTAETPATFRYYTSIADTDNGRGGWYTLEELQAAGKRTPLDGDIGYCLAEVEEEHRNGEIVKIEVINLAVYSAGNWIPASIGTDGKDVLMKFDELFASYIWDCLTFKGVVADNLFIGSDSEGNGVHNITTNEHNFRQLDFAFTGDLYANDPNAGSIIAEIEGINNSLNTLNDEYTSTSDEGRRRDIMNSVNILKNQLREKELELETHEEGINFTSSYKHINFGSPKTEGESEEESTVKSNVNIYNDTYFNREGTTTFRNNVVFDGNATSDDSESSDTESYKKPSLTINGYDHIDISNIASADTQTDPIHIGADIGVGGKLSIEGDLEAEDISSNSVTCVGSLRGERLNVRGVTTEDGQVSMSKAIISKNGRTITAVPAEISDSNINTYLGSASKKTYLSSIGRTYLGDYESTGSKSEDSKTITRSSNSNTKYVFGTTTVPVNSVLEFTYKGYGVAASIYYRHFTKVNFSASMSYRIEVKLFKYNGSTAIDNRWITLYSGKVSGLTGFENGDNKTWKTTYRYLICSLASGGKLTEDPTLTTYYTIAHDTSAGKITLIPTDTAKSLNVSFNIRVAVDSISSSVSDDTVWWKGVGGVGINSIGIANKVTSSGLVNSANIGNYIDLYTTPVSSNEAQAVLFSNALLIGNPSSYFYFKIRNNNVYICGKSGSGAEQSRSILNLTTGDET